MSNETRTGDNRTQMSNRESASPRTAVRGLEMTAFAMRVVVGVLITVLILSVTFVLWRGIHVLLEAFAGLLFAVFLSAMADWLSQRTKLSYRWALVVVLV